MALPALAGFEDSAALLPVTYSASSISPSPARVPMASPYVYHVVGMPLRRVSLSMQGRSSWTREKLWIISIAAIKGAISLIQESFSSPQASANMRHVSYMMIGRTRFPPFLTASFIAFCTVVWNPLTSGRKDPMIWLISVTS